MKKISFIVLLFLATVLFIGCKKQQPAANPLSYNSQDLKILQETRDRESAKLIKAPNGWIYYLAADGKRYIFPTTNTFKSWFGDNQYQIKEMTLEEIGEIPLGGNVTYRPGSKLIRTATDPKTYYVEKGGVLRPFENEEAIEKAYGKNWQELVDDLENYYFTNYKAGKQIKPEDIPITPPEFTIDEDKGLGSQIPHSPVESTAAPGSAVDGRP